MKVVITGSHFSPAYAVIKKSDWEVVVVGRKYALHNSKKPSYEYKICEENKIPFQAIKVPRFSRVSPFRSILSSFSLMKSIKVARKILRKTNPDVVISFGGYIALPVVIAAYIMKKPVIIHEQTLGAGFSNKISARFAKRVLISFSFSRKHFPKKKTYLTGNPIREEILNKEAIKPVIKTEKKIIYVTGGSTGSMAINDLLGKIIPSLSEYFIIHQHGISDKNTFQHLSNYLAKPYFSPTEVAWIMQNASLIISRSGINTVTEALYLGTPAIFIPLPYGQKNEQLKNARYAEKHGRAKYFIQEKVTGREMISAIRDMMRKGRLKKIDPKMKRHENAAEHIVYEAEKLYQRAKERASKR